MGQLAHADGGPLSAPPATFPTLTGVTFSTVSFEANGRSDSLKLPSIIDIVRKSLSYERTHRPYHTNELNISMSIHKTAYTEAFFSCRAVLCAKPLRIVRISRRNYYQKPQVTLLSSSDSETPPPSIPQASQA